MDSKEQLLQELQVLNFALLRHLRRQLEDGVPAEALNLKPDIAPLLLETPPEKLVSLCRINQMLFVPSAAMLEAIKPAPRPRSVESQLLCEASEEEKTPKARRAQGG